jgi:urease accessory protein
VGLAGFSVSGTFIAAGADIGSVNGSAIGSELQAHCRTMEPGDRDSRVGVTTLPRVLLARYLGHSSQDAFAWFTAIWTVLRPALLRQPAIAPRLWAC